MCISYVIKNVANSVEEFESHLNTIEYLLAMKLLLRFSKSKSYKTRCLKDVKSIYSNKKYDNKTIQLVAGMIITQMIN